MASRTIAIKISVETSNSVQAVQSVTGAMQGLGLEQAKISQLQDGLTNSFIKGNLAARAISMGFTAMKDSAVFAVGQLANLELTLARVQAVTGASKDQTNGLSDSIFKLGRDTSSSVQDISKASLELAKLGFAGKNLEIVLGGVSRLSSVLGDSLEATGQLVGGVVQTFDLSAKQAESVADKLFVATGKSAASIDSFRTAFGLAGNVAANAGVSFEELAAVIATLSNQGIKASTIGTGLRTWITNLSMEGSKAQKVLGGSFEEMGLLGSMERMAQVKPGTGTIFDMFGKPGSPVAAALMNSTDMYKDFVKAVQDGNGSLLTAGTIINDTLIGSVTRLQNSLLEVGNTFAKLVNASGEMNFFSKMAEQINMVTDSIKEQSRYDDFLKKHIADAKTPQQGMRNATAELGFAPGQRGTDDEMKSAFLRKTQQEKVRQDAFLLVAKKMQEDENRKFGIGQTDDRPTTTFDFKKKQKKVGDKKGAPDFDPMDVFDRLGDIQSNGDSYEENFQAKLAKDKLKAKGEDEKNRASMAKIIADKDKFAPEGYDGKGSEQKLKVKDAEQQAELAQFAKFQLDLTEVKNAQEKERYDYAMMLAQQELQMKLQVGAQFLNGMGALFVQLAKKNRDLAIAAKAIAMGEVVLNTAVAVSKVWGQTGIFGVAAQAAPIMAGAAQLMAINSQKFASGTDQIVTKPTMFMAGEAGKERVTVTPRSKMGGGGGGGITVNIQGDVMDGAKFTEAVEMAQKKLRGRNV